MQLTTPSAWPTAADGESALVAISSRERGCNPGKPTLTTARSGLKRVTRRACVLVLFVVTNQWSKSRAESHRRRKNSAGNPLHAPKRARVRTSLIGVTIYQPDLEPSPRGRRLLEALERMYSAK